MVEGCLDVLVNERFVQVCSLLLLFARGFGLRVLFSGVVVAICASGVDGFVVNLLLMVVVFCFRLII